MDIQLNDITGYEQALAAQKEMRAELLAAYNREDFKEALEIIDRMAKLLAPNDGAAMSTIAYLASTVAHTMYFGGCEHAMSEYRARKSYTPPF